jgi:hypothetical protein
VRALGASDLLLRPRAAALCLPHAPDAPGQTPGCLQSASARWHTLVVRGVQGRVLPQRHGDVAGLVLLTAAVVVGVMGGGGAGSVVAASLAHQGSHLLPY